MTGKGGTSVILPGQSDVLPNGHAPSRREEPVKKRATRRGWGPGKPGPKRTTFSLYHRLSGAVWST